jgi:hypothetical protein
MKLSLTKLQLIQQLHELLTYSNSKPILIRSQSYVDFMEKHYGQVILHSKFEA